MKIYIHIDTGIATAVLNATNPLQNIPIKRGDLFELYCVFHNGTAPVELPANTAGAFIVKKNQRYFEGALLLSANWVKQAAAADGYKFALTANTEPLNIALSDSDTLTAMGEVTWQIGEDNHTTQKIPVVVSNDIYKENEPPPASGGETWPLPDAIALKSEVQAVSDRLDEHIAAVPTARRIQSPDGSVWEETIDNAGILHWEKLELENP